MKKIIEGCLILPDQTVMGQLHIEGEHIISVVLDRSKFVSPDVVVPQGRYVSPGFIDLQINGAFGKEFKTDTDALNTVTQGLPQFGTTSICPTVTTRELESYPEHLASLRRQFTLHSGTRVLGFHLEGPFLNPRKVGAQSANLLKIPAESDYSSYGSADVIIVTLSPELAGSQSLIQTLIGQGKRIGIGHSEISYSECAQLYEPTRMMIVHLFNAMDGLQGRVPGLSGFALDRDDCYMSMIVDGVHVDPAVVRVSWKCKQYDSKFICVTDGSAVTGLENGVHAIGSRSIQKLPDRAVLEGTDTLVGSILTLNIAARNLRRFTGCSLSEAVNTVSLHPACFLGMEHNIGQLIAGGFADLVIHDNDFTVSDSYIAGDLVWSRGD